MKTEKAEKVESRRLEAEKVQTEENFTAKTDFL